MTIGRGSLPQRITVVHFGPGARNAYGNKERTETSRTENVPARLQQRASAERTTDQALVVDQWDVVIGDPTVAITAGDEVIEGVRIFTVDGTPDVVYDRRAPHHIEAALRYVKDVT